MELFNMRANQYICYEDYGGDSSIPNPRKQTSFYIPSLTTESSFFFFPGAGHPSQVFNKLWISLPLLRAGGARSSSLPSNRCPSFLHGCFLGSHLRDPWNTVFEDPGSFSSWRYIVLSMLLTQAQNPWTTCPEKYPNPR